MALSIHNASSISQAATSGGGTTVATGANFSASVGDIIVVLLVTDARTNQSGYCTVASISDGTANVYAKRNQLQIEQPSGDPCYCRVGGFMTPRSTFTRSNKYRRNRGNDRKLWRRDETSRHDVALKVASMRLTCREISSAQTITAMRILSRAGLRI